MNNLELTFNEVFEQRGELPRLGGLLLAAQVTAARYLFENDDAADQIVRREVDLGRQSWRKRFAFEVSNLMPNAVFEIRGSRMLIFGVGALLDLVEYALRRFDDEVAQVVAAKRQQLVADGRWESLPPATKRTFGHHIGSNLVDRATSIGTLCFVSTTATFDVEPRLGEERQRIEHVRNEAFLCAARQGITWPRMSKEKRQIAKAARRATKAAKDAPQETAPVEEERAETVPAPAVLPEPAALPSPVEPASKQDAFLQLDAIKPRPNGDTRVLNAGHVLDLAESIAALGVVSPIAIDQHNHLLAGAHRLAASRLVVQEDVDERIALMTELCGKKPSKALRTRLADLPCRVDIDPVPVRVFQVDARTEQDLALAIEAAENALRRDYTPQEVRDLYDRLIAAGYTDREGKLRTGEKAAKPAVAAIIGRSVRTVRRYLAAAEEKKSLTRTDAGCQLVEKVERRLTSIVRELRLWAEDGGEVPGEVNVLLDALDSPTLREVLEAAKGALDSSAIEVEEVEEVPGAEDEGTEAQTPEPVESPQTNTPLTTPEGDERETKPKALTNAAHASVAIEPEASRAPVSDQVESKEPAPGAERDNQPNSGVEAEQGDDAPAVKENETSLKAESTAMQNQAPEAPNVPEASDETDGSKPNGAGSAVGAGSDGAQPDGEKRMYTRHAPTNDQLDTWASRWGVQIPATTSRRAVWGRYRELIRLAAVEHSVDLSELPESHWRDGDLPAARLIEEAVGVAG